MTLLNNGNVLTWDAYSSMGGTFVWNPTTGVLTDAAYLHVDNLFCSGHTVLSDGRVLVNGGHIEGYVGRTATATFNPVTGTWTTGTQMAYERWYPSTVALPDGRALTVSGAINCSGCRIPGEPDEGIAEIPEIYDPIDNSWILLPGAARSIPLYPHLFSLPDGRVLAAGTAEDPIASLVLDMNTQAWSVVDPVIRQGGSSVMYQPGKIMKAGSAINPDYPIANSSATTFVLDMTAPSPAWTQTASMAFPRTKHNLTILPDGNVLVTGGSISSALTGVAVKEAEIWSPTTQTWTTMAPMVTPRLYHSTAILLLDGRVVTAGGGRYLNADYLNAEIYSPPYLFQGARPTITTAPATIDYATGFNLTTPDAARAARVTLVKPGSATHAFNFAQQFVELSFTAGAGSLTVQGPANRNIAPPGVYMLFVIDTDGVPSVGRFVTLPVHQDLEPPTAPSNLAASGTSDSVGLAWTGSTDNFAIASYDVHRSATQGFTPSGATRIVRTASTSYVDRSHPGVTQYYKVIARDAKGNSSGASNQAAFTGPPLPPPGSGLQAAYAFNEGSGPTTADFSGNGFTGTLANGATWTPSGKYGAAVLINATDDGNETNDPKVMLGRDLDIPEPPFTISAWVYPASYADHRVILSKRDSPTAEEMRLDWGLAAGSGSVYLFSGATLLSFAYAPPLNAWTHVAIVAEATSTKLYVGGNLQQTLGAIPLGLDHEANLVIGGTGDTVDNDPYSGQIDDLRIYDRALPQPDVVTDMNTPVNTVVVGVESPLPARTVLRVFPNPFHSMTRIQALETENVSIYSVSGRLIRTWKRAGSAALRSVDWDGADDKGRQLPSGIYIVKAGTRTARVALLR